MESTSTTERTITGDITTRLRRIEGQVRGVQRMLDEGRDCEEMLTQAMAIRSAVDQVGQRLMEYHLDRCLLEGFDCEPERMQNLRHALKLWTKFGQPAPALSLPYGED
ncbi:MAG: metal-sensitive transcriptional regulator [Chloroflexi bacterium]|nr:metal-sensitive transcriptional regulator [Chloroflexota bacterium]